MKDFYPGALDAFGANFNERDAPAILEIAPPRPSGVNSLVPGSSPLCER